MKGQLTRANNGRLKNFSYGAITISFTIESIPLLRPQQILVDEVGPRDPWMLRWVSLMACHGGNGLVVRYAPDFLYVWVNRSSQSRISHMHGWITGVTQISHFQQGHSGVTQISHFQQGHNGVT